MKTNFKEKKITESISQGDAIILKDGRKFLVIRITLTNDPWSLINIETMQELNVYDSLGKIKNTFEKDIVRIIKHENLEIREVE